MKREELLEELKGMSAKEFGKRIEVSTATPKQKRELTALWYSLNRKKDRHIDNDDIV